MLRALLNEKIGIYCGICASVKSNRAKCQKTTNKIVKNQILMAKNKNKKTKLQKPKSIGKKNKMTKTKF